MIGFVTGLGLVFNMGRHPDAVWRRRQEKLVLQFHAHNTSEGIIEFAPTVAMPGIGRFRGESRSPETDGMG